MVLVGLGVWQLVRGRDGFGRVQVGCAAKLRLGSWMGSGDAVQIYDDGFGQGLEAAGCLRFEGIRFGRDLGMQGAHFGDSLDKIAVARC